MANPDDTSSSARVEERNAQQSQSNKKNQKKKNGNGYGNQFKGMTAEMNGHVFQLHSEQKKRTVRRDTECVGGIRKQNI